MSSSSLRLVVGPSGDVAAPALDLPIREGAPVHVHLHLGAQAPVAVATATASSRRRWVGRLLYIGATAALAAFSYDVGTFTHRPAVYATAAPAGVPTVPSGIPPAFRAQLAQPPVVTPPPAASAAGSAFGLHP